MKFMLLNGANSKMGSRQTNVTSLMFVKLKLAKIIRKIGEVSRAITDQCSKIKRAEDTNLRLKP